MQFAFLKALVARLIEKYGQEFVEQLIRWLLTRIQGDPQELFRRASAPQASVPANGFAAVSEDDRRLIESVVNRCDEDCPGGGDCDPVK